MHPCHESQRRARFSLNQKGMVSLWKIIPILSAFAFSLLLFVCCFCVKETISAMPFLASYIDAGKSVFLPFIPRINLFCFLPEDAQVLPFTIGHLIDFIFIVNLSMVVNPIALPFCKKVSREYQQNQFFDLHIGYVHPRQRATWTFLDVHPTILVNNQSVLDDVKEPGFGQGLRRPGLCGMRRLDGEAKDGHAVGFFAWLWSRPLRSTNWRGSEGIHTRISPLYRIHTELPGRERVATRSRFAPAFFASLFVPIPTLSARHR